MAGNNGHAMKTSTDMTEFNFKLLSSLDFEEVSALIAELLLKESAVNALAMLIYDEDMEAFTHFELFGPDKSRLKPICEAFTNEDVNLGFLDNGHMGELNSAQLKPSTVEVLNGTIPYLLIKDEIRLCALVLLPGLKSQQIKSLAAILENRPIFQALSNAWDIRELKRENARLRSRYEELEDKNSLLEDQTRKLIQDITLKDVLRTRQLSKDKLLHEISSSVKNSMDIQRVFKQTVQDLSRIFELSRCVVVHPTQGDSFEVIESCTEQAGSSRERFFSPEGKEFTTLALGRTAPCDLLQLEMSFNPAQKAFINSLGLVSAILVPLSMRGIQMGFVFMQDCIIPRPWSIDDLAFFGTLATQLAIAFENASLHEEKKQQAVTDGLTGISNRRHFNEEFEREFERARRYNEPLTLCMIDMDYLKRVNDNHGHSAGDSAIKAIGDVLRISSRSIDVAARYGGEEFCLLLPNTTIEESIVIAERIRAGINDFEIPGYGKISASIGVANYPLHANEPKELFERADEALYAAKQTGRNKVHLAGE